MLYQLLMTTEFFVGLTFIWLLLILMYVFVLLWLVYMLTYIDKISGQLPFTFFCLYSCFRQIYPLFYKFVKTVAVLT